MILDRQQQSLLLEGHAYSAAEIRQLTAEVTETTPAFLRDLYSFLLDWFSDSPVLDVHTSGSTGVPKQLTVRKEQMMQSARLTCEALRLRRDDTALLCMPLQYIAGKMVVVRALVAGLNLILRTPSGHPLADVDVPLRFAAMVPLQVFNTLRVAEEKERLCRTDILIIGGGAIDTALEKEIQQLPGEVYSTYGMTETLSHIALRRVNGAEASAHYTPFPSVRLSLSPDDTLMIHAPLVCDEWLTTNDVVRIEADGTFVVLGRKDNVINSGGIKLQAERLEELLRPAFPARLAITSVPDPKLGEAVVLLIEDTTAMDCIEETVNGCLSRYERPQHIRMVDALPLTGSGKIDRAALRLLAKELI